MSRRSKYSLSPITRNPEETDNEDVVIDSELDEILPESSDKIPVDAGLDSYLNTASSENLDKLAEKELELEGVKKENDDLKKECETLKKELETLKNTPVVEKKEPCDPNAIASKYDKLREKYDMLNKENDKLLLRNSELEFELAKCNETMKNLKNQLASMTNPAKHTYGQSAYKVIQDMQPSMNGYEEWK